MPRLVTLILATLFLAPVASAACDEACSERVQERLNRFRTSKVREDYIRTTVAPAPRALLCEGVPVLPCLRRSFGADWLAVNNAIAPHRVTFVSAGRRGGDRVQLVLGEVYTDEEGGATHVVVLADDTVADPILAAMAPDANAGWRQLGAYETLAEDFVVTPGAATMALNRPLRADEAVYAVCDARVEHVDRPPLIGIGSAEVEGGEVGVYPTYRYALPCVARLVLSGNIRGIRPGPYVRTPLVPKSDHTRTTIAGAVTVREAERHCSIEGVGEPLTLHNRECDVLFVGDLNGDGPADVLVETWGEMGCGGIQLYLSGPRGWSAAGGATRYC